MSGTKHSIAKLKSTRQGAPAGWPADLTQRNVGVICKLEADQRARRGMKGDTMKQVASILLTLLSSGCVVIGGYSSERGWFLWPGTIVIFLVVAVLFLLLRRRK
jgi:hypothetical protein